MIIYFNDEELTELYKAMNMYAHSNSGKSEKAENLLNKITYECMYYDSIEM